jgi:1-aminocyclopropane-1-carboxylate deaminase
MDDLLDSILSDPNGGTVVDRTPSGIHRHQRDDTWMTIDWRKTTGATEDPGGAATPSPVETILVRDRLVYVKRDDQLRLAGSQLSGNKARKMLSLALLPDDDFPECIVSYGGPQSNAMLALAAIVNFRNQQQESVEPIDLRSSDSANGSKEPTIERSRYRFVYYTKKLPRFLRSQPSGNLFRAKILGMELVELAHDEYDRLFGGDYGGNANPPSSLLPPVPGGKSLYVPQGGACEMARLGTRQLAHEIVDFWAGVGKGRPLSVVVPGGTCSTALFLHCAVKDLLLHSDRQPYKSLDVEVVVIPCVGDEGYALRQMTALNAAIQREPNDVPRILPPCTSMYDGSFKAESPRGSTASYFTFGEPHRKVLDAWSEMKDEHQLVLDLLYGSPSWAILFRHFNRSGIGGGAAAKDSPIASRALMYVHSGGLEGINSQLLRYKYKNLVNIDQIQLPGRSTDVPATNGPRSA